MPRNVLLSIKPKYVEKIFEGKKCYEFRRVMFRTQGVAKIIIYASQPVQKVVGEFEIEEILSLRPKDLWDCTKELSGIEKKYFDEYFKGKTTAHAIKIKNVKRYELPQDIQEDYNFRRPPQSFRYLVVQ